MKLLFESHYKIYELPIDKEEKYKLFLKTTLTEEEITSIIDETFLFVEDDFVFPNNQRYEKKYISNWIESGRTPAIRKNPDEEKIFLDCFRVTNHVDSYIKTFHELHEQTKLKHNRLKILKYL